MAVAASNLTAIYHTCSRTYQDLSLNPFNRHSTDQQKKLRTSPSNNRAYYLISVDSIGSW
jgi:hypothetical protein